MAKPQPTVLLIILALIGWSCIGNVAAGKHELVLEAEDRPSILITIFDFFRGGSLSMNLHNITITDKNKSETHNSNSTQPGSTVDYGKYDGKVGFVLDRTSSAGDGPYFSSVATISNTKHCPFSENEEMAIFTDNSEQGLIQRIVFSFNFKKKEGRAGCNRLNRSLRKDISIIWNSITAENCTQRNSSVGSRLGSPYAMNFNISMLSDRSMGLYSLYFVHCNTSAIGRSELVSLNMTVVARNKIHPRDLFFSSSKDSFLYFFMGALFFGAGIYWAFYFRGTCNSEENGQAILRIHYLMLILVTVKSLSLLFLAGHIHYLERYGEQKAAWGLPYYITKIVASALTFVIILMIETGLAFSSAVSSSKPRFTPKALMIIAVVMLQVMSSITEIITEESEPGQSVHYTSSIMSMTLNSFCVAIVLLYPLARKCYRNPNIGGGSAFDNEGILRARMCSKKLKIFRRFYFVVFCYFYISRIWFGTLVPLMLPNEYDWLGQAGVEITTLVVFAIIGYMFGPTRNNAYLTLGQGLGMDDANEVAFS